MEEKLFEMEYVINGEKYLITATKVNEEVKTSTTGGSCKNPQNDSYEFNNDALVFNVNDIPDGMDVDTWLSIVDMYGIILTR